MKLHKGAGSLFDWDDFQTKFKDNKEPLHWEDAQLTVVGYAFDLFSNLIDLSSEIERKVEPSVEWDERIIDLFSKGGQDVNVLEENDEGLQILVVQVEDREWPLDDTSAMTVTVISTTRHVPAENKAVFFVTVNAIKTALRIFSKVRQLTDGELEMFEMGAFLEHCVLRGKLGRKEHLVERGQAMTKKKSDSLFLLEIWTWCKTRIDLKYALNQTQAIDQYRDEHPEAPSAAHLRKLFVPFNQENPRQKKRRRK